MDIDNRFGLYTAFNLGLNKMMKIREKEEDEKNEGSFYKNVPF